MKNLLELKRFLENNINCLCFYNKKEDNYKEKLNNDFLKINTLSVYFINGIDFRCERLANLYNSNGIYEENVVKMSGFFGNILFLELIVKDKTIAILNQSPLFLSGGLDAVIKYYTGIDVSGITFGYPGIYKEMKFPKSTFNIKKGDNCAVFIEKYLCENGYNLVKKESGFYINEFANEVLNGTISLGQIAKKSEEIERLKNLYFSNEIEEFNKLVAFRKKEYSDIFNTFSLDDWNEYKKIIGADEYDSIKTEKFDD